jgi:hypothetical protein
MLKRIMPVVILLLATGCAGFQSGELKELSSLPEVEQPRDVYISMDFTRELNGEESYMLNELKKSSYLGSARDVFDDQENVDVVEEPSNADVHVHVDFTENERSNIGMAVITGLTFWLVPNEVSMRYTADVSVRQSYGTGFQVSDHTTTYHQIFLLPVMPIKLPAIERTHAVEKIFRHTFKRLHGQGVVRRRVEPVRGDRIGRRSHS